MSPASPVSSPPPGPRPGLPLGLGRPARLAFMTLFNLHSPAGRFGPSADEAGGRATPESPSSGKGERASSPAGCRQRPSGSLRPSCCRRVSALKGRPMPETTPMRIGDDALMSIAAGGRQQIPAGGRTVLVERKGGGTSSGLSPLGRRNYRSYTNWPCALFCSHPPPAFLSCPFRGPAPLIR